MLTFLTPVQFVCKFVDNVFWASLPIPGNLFSPPILDMMYAYERAKGLLKLKEPVYVAKTGRTFNHTLRLLRDLVALQENCEVYCHGELLVSTCELPDSKQRKELIVPTSTNTDYTIAFHKLLGKTYSDTKSFELEAIRSLYNAVPSFLRAHLFPPILELKFTALKPEVLPVRTSTNSAIILLISDEPVIFDDFLHTETSYLIDKLILRKKELLVEIYEKATELGPPNAQSEALYCFNGDPPTDCNVLRLTREEFKRLQNLLKIKQI